MSTEHDSVQRLAEIRERLDAKAKFSSRPDRQFYAHSHSDITYLLSLIDSLGNRIAEYERQDVVWEFVYTCRDCKGTGRIPAPSVPSDERCSTCDRREREDCPQCEFDIHREAPGIGACQKHHPFSYPPAPSQDAEGDGLDGALRERDEAEAWADRLAYAIAPVSVIGEHSSANNPWMNALEIVGQRESAIREPYEALVKARGWSARVEYDGQFALVIEWPGEPPYGRYWWVLCPAAATLHDDPPSEDEDPTEHDHGACSLSPECDFNELHALAHQAIRDRAAALESLGGRS